jgi:hypothetical protein
MAFVHDHGFVAPSGILKSTPSDGQLVGAYGVRFSGADEKDLAGEFFTAETDFGPSLGTGVPTMLNHGRALAPEMDEFAGLLLPAATVRKDSNGLFVETRLDPSDPLHETLLQLISLGALRWSSGTGSQLMMKAGNGEILAGLPSNSHSHQRRASRVCPRSRDSTEVKKQWHLLTSQALSYPKAKHFLKVTSRVPKKDCASCSMPFASWP